MSARAAEMLAAGDPDRFAALMATRADLRARLWPLYAANLEIARAPWASAEPIVAEMRLQWWVDAFAALAEEGRAPAHELGAEFADLRAEAGLLQALAEARRWECWREPFEDQAALVDYLEATSGGLYWAAARRIGAGAEAEGAVRTFGFGAGVAAWLAAVPELEARGRLPLVDGRPEAVAALAREGLAALERGLAQTPAPLRAALLPGWQARGWLRAAAKEPARVAEGRLRGSEFGRRAGLVWQALRLG